MEQEEKDGKAKKGYEILRAEKEERKLRKKSKGRENMIKGKKMKEIKTKTC